ncbi:hypothetical protein Q9Q94_14445 [Uliginosibacterium sp. 31-16]|uniref:hypothetical protein n=1 Tax=Uliginosibacterium sp. 31-16 TaxID=3068315 RepID=UPI0027400011|nr:hypothetical protein [Uliginosibacterium sp. 31-16]MDP5240742.1 hypothetical protein [Uliginosibacterium sp. 31-16]
MKLSTLKRFGAGAMLVFGMASAVAWAAAVCTNNTSLGSVLSVLDDGKINIAAGNCNLRFYGVSTVGTKNGNYVEPEAGKCYPYVSDTEKSTTPVIASGVSSASKPLDAWQESGSSFNFSVSASSINFGKYTAVSQYWGTYAGSLSNTADGDHVITDAGRTVTFKKAGNVYTLPSGDYDTISVEAGQGSIVFSGPVRIKKLIITNNNSVTFAQDDSASTPSKNFIDEFNLSSAARLHLSGTGLTTLNILGKNATTGGVSGWSIGSQVCINYLNCDPTQEKTTANMAMQNPDRLQINVYNGDLVTQGSFAIAAGVYVANGAINFSNGTPITVVGEVLGKSISLQNNAGTQLYYKSTSAATLQADAYSLTPPAIDAITQEGSLIYRAMQSDYRQDGSTPGTSGHLRAFRLKADSSQEDTPVWDAATRMTLADRQSKIFTDSDAKTFRTLLATPASEFTNGTLTGSADCIINPNCQNGAKLGGRDPDSLVGTPWRTHPLIVGQSVLFATDDGILYSISRTTGDLQWGWIPRQILPLTGDSAALRSQHPWGQINSAQITVFEGGAWVSKTYVTGAALGGQLHFAILLSNDGASLSEVVWSDYRANQFSPGSATWGGFTGLPYGGGAPIVGAGNKVIYIVGNKLVVRNLDGSGTVETKTISSSSFGNVSSNLIYLNDSSIFFGSSKGRVWQMDINGDVVPGVNDVDLGLTEPVTYLNGARMVSGGGNSLQLLAQSANRVSVLRFFADTWSRAWFTGVGASSDVQVPYIPATNSAWMSAPADIMNGKVVLYYTTKDFTGCDVRGYAFGPLSLVDGAASLLGTRYRLITATNLSHYLGKGEAVGGTLTRFKGRYGVWGASAGSSFKPSGSGSSSGSGGGSNSGAGNIGTGAGTTDANGGHLDSDDNVQTKRLNWRELTNFF